jgi:hypothetical protein
VYQEKKKLLAYQTSTKEICRPIHTRGSKHHAEMGNWHQYPNSAVAKVTTSNRFGKIDLTPLVCKGGENVMRLGSLYPHFRGILM